jgi:archaetidylinositol phosphate synthase
MIDGTSKATLDRFWDAVARPLARSGLTPNQITWIGLGLVLANCALFALHRSSILFGLGLAVSFAFDSLDGAVARLQGTASKYGGYLDAVIDRYQEIAVYLTIAWLEGWWLACFLAATGSLLTSYHKARTAIEMPIDNSKWPDLLERLERVIILCIALVLDSLFTLPAMLGGRVLLAALVVLGVLTHVTAIQRFVRARAMLTHRDKDRSGL